MAIPELTTIEDEPVNKYTPVHVDVHDTVLRKIIEEALSGDLTENRSVTNLMRLSDGMWVIRLEYSFSKASENERFLKECPF